MKFKNHTKALFGKYEMLNELGRGAFSIVKLAKNKQSGGNVAVKIIEKKNVAPEYKKNLETETEILRKVSHPSIIQLLEMYETDEFLFLVMELVVGGELFDRIVEKVSLSSACPSISLVFLKFLKQRGLIPNPRHSKLFAKLLKRFITCIRWIFVTEIW